VSSRDRNRSQAVSLAARGLGPALLLAFGLLAVACGSDSSSVKDCNGVSGGSAKLDQCGVCQTDPANDCVQDCAGTWGGTAVIDPCGVCQSDPSNACVLPNTIPAWDGSQFISSFGVPNTATYGQTITVWDGADPMTGFTFEIKCNNTVTLRGSVYAWDGLKATGSSLFTSDPQTLQDGDFQEVSFDTGSLSLPAGDYVIFASTSADQSEAPNSACKFGAVADTSYTAGNFVFLNNGTDTSMWTADSWSTIPEDLAFRVDGLYQP